MTVACPSDRPTDSSRRSPSDRHLPSQRCPLAHKNTPAYYRPVIDICPQDAATAIGGKCAAERERRQSHHLPPGWRDKVGVFVHTAAVILWGKVALSAYPKQSRIVDQHPKASDDLSWSSHVLPTDSSRRSPSHRRRNVRWPHTRYGHCRVINIRKSSQIDGDLGSSSNQYFSGF